MSASGVRVPSDTAARALGHQHRLGHQQAEHVLLLGKVVSSTRGRPPACRMRTDRAAQHVLHLLGEQVLLRHIHLAAHPGLAHRRGERRHRVGDEALQALFHERLA